MSITSGFFNSVDGDRLYNARDMSMYFKGLISDGVFENVDGKFQVTAGGGMTVNVAAGRAIIDCQWVNNDAAETLTIDAPDVGKTRKDAIALRLDMNEDARNITLIVKKGEAAASGAALPTRTWTESVKELYLAYVTVTPSTTAIGTSVITDLRGTSHCPYVTGLIDQVDTAELFAQYQAKCEEYYNTMTTQLDAYIQEKTSDFNAFMASLTGELKVDTSIKKYEHYDLYKSDTGYIDNIPMPLAAYNSNSVTLIHVGGVLLVEGVEYTIEGGTGTGATITFPNRLKDNGEGVPITVIVIDSVIGGGGSGGGSGGVIAAQVDYSYNTNSYLVDGTNITLHNQADNGADVSFNFIGADIDTENNRVFVNGTSTSYGHLDYTPSESDITEEYTMYLVVQGATANAARFLITPGKGYVAAIYSSFCILGSSGTYRVEGVVNGGSSSLIASEISVTERAVITVRRNDQGIITLYVNGVEIGELSYHSYGITAGQILFGIISAAYNDGGGYYFYEFDFAEQAHDTAAIIENCTALMEKYEIS